MPGDITPVTRVRKYTISPGNLDPRRDKQLGIYFDLNSDFETEARSPNQALTFFITHRRRDGYVEDSTLYANLNELLRAAELCDGFLEEGDTEYLPGDRTILANWLAHVITHDYKGSWSQRREIAFGINETYGLGLDIAEDDRPPNKTILKEELRRVLEEYDGIALKRLVHQFEDELGLSKQTSRTAEPDSIEYVEPPRISPSDIASVKVAQQEIMPFFDEIMINADSLPGHRWHRSRNQQPK